MQLKSIGILKIISAYVNTGRIIRLLRIGDARMLKVESGELWLYRWALLAVFVAELPILVLSHGFAGTGSATSAVFMAATMGALLVSGRVPDLRATSADLLFAGMVAAITVSCLNGMSDPREYVLLTLTLVAYLAGRMFGGTVPEQSFVWVAGAVTVLGAGVTLYFLAVQYGDLHGKPLLFGLFDAAPAQILGTGCMLAFALMSNEKKAGWFWVGILALCAVIFAASQVRFTFVAFACALFVVNIKMNKRRLMAVGGGLALAVGIGLLARPAMALTFFSQFDLSGVCGASDNSIAIRGQLLREAIALIPDAGPFGLGLGGFLDRTCLPGNEVHNSALQALVEFGWLGGGLYLGLIAAALAGILRRPSPFALYGLIFALTQSLAYGRFSRDGVLLFFLGYAVRSSQSPVPVLETKLLATSSSV